MSDIWRKDGETWSRLGPSAFPNEQELHDRILEAPEMLPLAGQPSIVATYREVWLGGGAADILAFTADGCPVIIEVKLSRNADARRAIVAQGLAYAAALHGLPLAELEREILLPHLQADGQADLATAVEKQGVDVEAFRQTLAGHLAAGSCRIVFVLDAVPPPLVQLVGYLAAQARSILIDLVVLSVYTINGAEILVAERVDPAHLPVPLPGEPAAAGRTPPLVTAGAARFQTAIDTITDGARQQTLSAIVAWAERGVTEGLWRLNSSEGKTVYGLLLRLLDERAGIASVYLPKDPSKDPELWIQFTVGRRRAPNAIGALATVAGLAAELAAGKQWGAAAAITDEVQQAIGAAYREAQEG